MSVPTLSPVRNPRSSAAAQGEGLAAGGSTGFADPYAGLPMPVQPSDPQELPFAEPPLAEDEDDGNA